MDELLLREMDGEIASDYGYCPSGVIEYETDGDKTGAKSAKETVRTYGRRPHVYEKPHFEETENGTPVWVDRDWRNRGY